MPVLIIFFLISWRIFKDCKVDKINYEAASSRKCILLPMLVKQALIWRLARSSGVGPFFFIFLLIRIFILNTIQKILDMNLASSFILAIAVFIFWTTLCMMKALYQFTTSFWSFSRFLRFAIMRS